MSFKCQNCGTVQPHKTSPIMVVALKRSRFYPEVRDYENEIVESAGRGWDTVKEKACCATCAPKVERHCKFVK